MMAGKRKKKKKKSRCSNDGDFGLRGRRYWRDENEGDSVPMTESWQVLVWHMDAHFYVTRYSIYRMYTVHRLDVIKYRVVPILC